MNSILIVDDDADLREILSDVLGERGFRVTCAMDGAEALALLETYQPDVILLDYMMPGMNGIEFCLAQRERGQQIPIVLFTAAQGKLELGTAKPTEILRKPCATVDLLRILNRICGSAEPDPEPGTSGGAAPEPESGSRIPDPETCPGSRNRIRRTDAASSPEARLATPEWLRTDPLRPARRRCTSSR